MIEFKESLRKAGLTGNEVKVYLELLEKGPLSANALARNIGMDRTLTYTVLNHLIEKGLVNYVIKSNKKFFNAENPENLLNPVKEKEAFIKSLIPRLKSIEKIKEVYQEIKIYEGKEGLRSILRLMMRYKSFCSFGATGRAYDILYGVPALTKEWIKKGGSGRLITNPKYKKHEIAKIKNVKTRYLDVDSKATTSIYGDYVSIHISAQKPLIILIKNKELAETYQNHFEVLWKVAKRL